MSNDNKRKIIPEEIKENIDDILEKQLFNANRYYAESNSNISSLMIDETKKIPTDFLKELRNRWNWHNVFYEDLLEPAYLELFEEKYNNLTPLQVEELIEIYKTCCLVDEATLVTSGAIKKYLQENMSSLMTKSFSMKNKEIDEEMFMLITPPVDTFFTQIYIDHLTYIILLKTGSQRAETYKKYLLKQYHAEDEKVFEGRFKKYLPFMNENIETLYKKINECKISDNYKIKHFYYTMENLQRKAYRDIVIYDNLDEKLIASQLIGISGFLFRKKILSYLNDSNILPNKGYIYEFTNEEVISGLNKLLNERRKTMEKDVRPYKQRGMTCAISCMLMALEYYKKIPKADWAYEKKYYRSYRSRYIDGTPFSALAWHFSKNGLETELIHSEKQTFKNDGILSANEYDKSLEEYNAYLDRANEKGAVISNGVNINSQLIKRKLEEDKLVIIAGQIGSILHAILICGYEDDCFIVCDPLCKQKQKIFFEDIDKFMDTSIGKWFVTVKEAKMNKEKLNSNLMEFQEIAKKKLNINEKEKKLVKER